MHEGPADLPRQIAPRLAELHYLDLEAARETAEPPLPPHASEAGARHATVQGRVKTAQSLFEKGVLRGKAVNDLLALRVIIEPSAAGQAEEAACAAQCRSVQNLVDTLWPGSIVAVKDYIAHPKGNGYQSLHLLVDIGAGHRLELQVRTRCMHEHAERGAAAHTRYKADAVLAYT